MYGIGVFLSEESGQSMAEYALIIGIIVVAMFSTMDALKGAVLRLYQFILDQLAACGIA